MVSSLRYACFLHLFATSFADHCPAQLQSFVVEDEKFQHILRILNTNVDGRHRVVYALTKIKGIGRRFSNLICKKAQIDLNKRCVWFKIIFILCAR